MVSYGACPPWVAKVRGRGQGFREGYNKALQVKKLISPTKNNNIESPLILNMNIIIEKIKELKNPEEYVKDKFENEGWECEDCRMAGGGHPDFIFRKETEEIYIEVKSPLDGLKMSQAKWILQNKDKKVIIYYVDNIDN